jgi:hypothetical protein
MEAVARFQLLDEERGRQPLRRGGRGLLRAVIERREEEELPALRARPPAGRPAHSCRSRTGPRARRCGQATREGVAPRPRTSMRRSSLGRDIVRSRHRTVNIGKCETASVMSASRRPPAPPPASIWTGPSSATATAPAPSSGLRTVRGRRSPSRPCEARSPYPIPRRSSSFRRSHLRVGRARPCDGPSDEAASGGNSDYVEFTSFLNGSVGGPGFYVDRDVSFSAVRGFTLSP